jgi:RNA polymerase sigma-70 factor (ECF subfamily)
MNDSERLKKVEEWVVAYQARIRAYLFSRTGDESDAKDICQDVFLIVMKQIDQFDFSKDPWPWLVAIAHNKLREYWRAAKKRAEVETIETWVADRQMENDETLPCEEAGARIEALRYCMEQLPPRARQLVQMIYLDRLDCEETARRLRQKAGAVRIAIHRIRKGLRTCVKSQVTENGA